MGENTQAAHFWWTHEEFFFLLFLSDDPSFQPEQRGEFPEAYKCTRIEDFCVQGFALLKNWGKKVRKHSSFINPQMGSHQDAHGWLSQWKGTELCA